MITSGPNQVVKRNYAVLFAFSDSRAYGDPEGEITIRTRPQVRFGEYRVDLFVTMQAIEGSPDNIQVHSAAVIVECDGAEFHDSIMTAN